MEEAIDVKLQIRAGEVRVQENLREEGELVRKEEGGE